MLMTNDFEAFSKSSFFASLSFIRNLLNRNANVLLIYIFGDCVQIALTLPILRKQFCRKDCGVQTVHKIHRNETGDSRPCISVELAY